MITRHGQPVIEFRPVLRPEPGPVTPADLEWLERVRIRPRQPPVEASDAMVGRMRDEDCR